MAKNQINFTKMSNEARNYINAFKDAALDLAKEDLRYKEEKKKLESKLEVILQNRENEINNGMSVDEATQRFSRVEIDKEIKAAQVNHEAIQAPLREAMTASYAFIPDGMHSAYERKINEGKRGDFLEAIKAFLNNLGLEECKQGQISKFAETMSDRFGAKYATAKSIVNDGKFSMSLKKSQFNKLFMAVFCDMYM